MTKASPKKRKTYKTVARRRARKKEAFLQAFKELGSVAEATALIKVNRVIPYQWAKDDPEFRHAFEEAKHVAVQILIEEAKRRAHSGVKEPVFYKGKPIAAVLKYSDVLLMFLIKAWAPEYREKYQHEVTGKDSGPIEHHHGLELDYDNLPEEELDRIIAGDGKAVKG